MNKYFDKEMRLSYAQTIEEIFINDKNVYALEADLSSAMATSRLKDSMGSNYINLGIMEANMLGVASGINLGGGYCFVHSFGQFLTRRAYDQLFVSLAYAGLKACLVGSDAGVSAEHNGGTHMTFEDMGIVRNIPGIKIYDVCDPIEFNKVLKESYESNSLAYIRTFRKKGEPVYKDSNDIGDGCTVLNQGKTVTIIASGLAVQECIHAVQELRKKGLDPTLLDCYRVKPLNKNIILDNIKNADLVITCENHSIINGLGSSIAELICENNPKRLVRMGIRDRFGQVGQQRYLLSNYGFDKETIVERVLEEINKII